MTFHPAERGTTAALAYEKHRDLLHGASERATAGRTWMDAVPIQHSEFLAQNYERGHVVIAPILDPAHITVYPSRATFITTPTQLARLHDGDVALATKLTDALQPVHSIGSIAAGTTVGGRVHEYPEERVTKFILDRGKSGPEIPFDTYDLAFQAAVALATEDPYANFHIYGRVYAGASPALAFISAAAIEVTAELALVSYEDDTPILGFEVVTGTIGA